MNSVQIINFFNSINALVELPLLKLVGSILGIILLFYLLLKWKIVLFFKDRLWGIFLGKKHSDFSNNKWKKFHQSNIDIAHFNVVYNVSANTEEQVEKYQKWLKRNGLSALQMINIKNFFNIEKLSFKTIHHFDLYFSIFINFILTIVFFICLNFVFTSAALIRVGENSPWFWISDSYAKNSEISLPPFINSNWKLTPNMCDAKEFDITKEANNIRMPQSAVIYICSSFSDGISQKMISNVIKQQKTFFGLMAILSLGYFWCIYRYIIKILLIKKLRLQIKRYRTKKWNKL